MTAPPDESESSQQPRARWDSIAVVAVLGAVAVIVAMIAYGVVLAQSSHGLQRPAPRGEIYAGGVSSDTAGSSQSPPSSASRTPSSEAQSSDPKPQKPSDRVSKVHSTTVTSSSSVPRTHTSKTPATTTAPGRSSPSGEVIYSVRSTDDAVIQYTSAKGSTYNYTMAPGDWKIQAPAGGRLVAQSMNGSEIGCTTKAVVGGVLDDSSDGGGVVTCGS